MGSRLIDLTGQRFGLLTVLGRGPNSKGGATWYAKCDCGNQTLVRGWNLRNGRTESCGCRKLALLSARKRHGQTRSSLYFVWSEMKQRCFNPSNRDYKDYGARGIVVCERWRRSFAAFVADMGPRPDGYTIDRIDNDGNYEPSNCRWATRLEQVHNRRVTPKAKQAGGLAQ